MGNSLGIWKNDLATPHGALILGLELLFRRSGVARQQRRSRVTAVDLEDIARQRLLKLPLLRRSESAR